MTTASIPSTMRAVLLRGHGGFDQLDFRSDVPTPIPSAGEVLINVKAAGINNTDINTRIGWYSKAVEGTTNAAADDAGATNVEADGGWSGALSFPRIQGADCCGEIVQVGAGVDASRVGERVLVRPMHEDPNDDRPFRCRTFGSEMNGAFADYTVAPSSETYAIKSNWSDIELASLPCAYSTAEGMLHRGELGVERVLITGASGGVGSAAIQLAKRRGATVIAVAGQTKLEAVQAAGADEVIPRGIDLAEVIAADSIDVVLDLVAGPGFGQLITALRRGGRYVASGAIGGPLVELDVRDLYLKDLALLGSTFQDPIVFENLIRYVEQGEIAPMVAATYPLSEIVTAQEAFLAKEFVGKIVLVP